jgi:folate-binding protein YgfZ
MNIPLDYQAAINGAAYYPMPDAGLIHLSGPDQRTFVQRQTTNNITLLTSGHAQITVLTSPVGRILDVLTVYPEIGSDEETLAIIPLPGRTPSTVRFLKSRIFIMDKVTVSDASPSHNHYWLFGPQADSILEHLDLAPLPDVGTVRSTHLGGNPITLIGQHGPGSTNYRLLVAQTAALPLEHALDQAGAIRLTPDSFDLLRIEAGLPAGGAELREDYTPLEVGLAAIVAENKGCYTGQEVLARQVNYDKITRQLTGLRLEALVAPGSTVFHTGQSVGAITSAAQSPRFGPVALAVVKRPFFEAGTILEAGEKGQAIAARACTLPFSDL